MTAATGSRIDTHAHVFEPGLTTIPTARYVPAYAATVQQYLTALRDNGFDRGVLVQPSFLGYDNSYLLAAIATAPDRLRGVVVIDPAALEEELSPARIHALHAAGVRGIRLNLLGRDVPPLAEESWQRAGRTMGEYGWHLEVQVEGTQWDGLSPMLAGWPSRAVIDHLGLPRLEHPRARAIVGELALLDHVWVKVSAPYRSPAPVVAEAVAAMVDATGGRRLVFGSDWPHTAHESTARSYPWSWWTPLLPPELVSAVLTGNAEELFGWRPGSA